MSNRIGLKTQIYVKLEQASWVSIDNEILFDCYLTDKICLKTIWLLARASRDIVSFVCLCKENSTVADRYMKKCDTFKILESESVKQFDARIVDWKLEQ